MTGWSKQAIKCNGSANSKLNPTNEMNKTSKLTKPQASNTKKNETQHKSEK